MRGVAGRGAAERERWQMIVRCAAPGERWGGGCTKADRLRFSQSVVEAAQVHTTCGR